MDNYLICYGLNVQRGRGEELCNLYKIITYKYAHIEGSGGIEVIIVLAEVTSNFRK